MPKTTNETKTTAKQLRRLSTYEVRRVNHAARIVGDESLASAALAEIKQRETRATPAEQKRVVEENWKMTESYLCG